MAGDVKLDFNGIGGLISGIGTMAKDIRAAITGKSVIDPAAQAELEAKVLELENKAMEIEASMTNAVQEVNKIEAASANPFVSCWRPFIGWVCGFGCAYSYVLLPLMNWIARICFKVELDFPALEGQSLTAMTLGLLGLGGMRTAERFKGVARQ